MSVRTNDAKVNAASAVHAERNTTLSEAFDITASAAVVAGIWECRRAEVRRCRRITHSTPGTCALLICFAGADRAKGIMKYAGLLRRESTLAWPLLQATAAATLAWLIAIHVAQHHRPFFAPIAAVVALNTTTGERGTHAFRLLFGVFTGIAVGEITILLLGSDYASLALATFTAMIIARHAGGARVMIAQAAASSILTVAVAKGEAGTQRLGDALIGGGVALLFSQVLFSPEPVGLIRRATVAALREMAHLLELTARALDDDSRQNPESILDSAHELHVRLGELREMTRAAARVARHSVYWRGRWEAVAHETAGARHLELVGGSVLVVVRTAMASDAPERRELATVVRDCAEVTGSLAEAPRDQATRQRAVDLALHIARLDDPGAPNVSALAAASLTARMLATDLLAFIGVNLTAMRRH